MLLVYLNYPNAAITIHADPHCGHVRSQKKERQRVAAITLASLSEELGSFVHKQHRFGANADVNDMWLEIDCSDRDFELAVAKFMQRMLGRRYRPFRESRLYICKCAKQ